MHSLAPASRPFYRHLYFWVLVGIVLGSLIGIFAPDAGVRLKPLSDGFIGLIKMLIGPMVFCTIVLGISEAGDVRKVGRVGLKALVYFEVVSTLALALGLVVMRVLKPGAGFRVDPASLDPLATSEYVQKAADQSVVDFLLHVIPKTFLDPFTSSGDLLQVLFIAILFGWAMTRMKERAAPVRAFIESASHLFFALIGLVMRLAPFGAGGAMAFTLGKYGVSALKPLAALMGTFYGTCLLFLVLVLAPIARLTGFSLWRLLRYLGDELMTVLGTSSSESALVPLMDKLERLGCPRAVVGLTVPAGYAFNLDGTNIYLTLATLFIAQALGIDLSLADQLSILAVAMLTSKGASGVTGAGFITLAATLAVVPQVPVAGLALIVGIDRFMSEARALTNLVGNAVASLVVARWEGVLDRAALDTELASPYSPK